MGKAVGAYTSQDERDSRQHDNRNPGKFAEGLIGGSSHPDTGMRQGQGVDDNLQHTGQRGRIKESSPQKGHRCDHKVCE